MKVPSSYNRVSRNRNYFKEFYRCSSEDTYQHHSSLLMYQDALHQVTSSMETIISRIKAN